MEMFPRDFQPASFPVLEISILVRIRRSAAAEETERIFRGDLMPGARGDEDRIARSYGARFAVDLHCARAGPAKCHNLRSQ